MKPQKHSTFLLLIGPSRASRSGGNSLLFQSTLPKPLIWLNKSSFFQLCNREDLWITRPGLLLNPCSAANVVGNHRFRCSDSEMCTAQPESLTSSPVGRTVVAHLGRGIKSGYENSISVYVHLVMYGHSMVKTITRQEARTVAFCLYRESATKAKDLTVWRRPWDILFSKVARLSPSLVYTEA